MSHLHSFLHPFVNGGIGFPKNRHRGKMRKIFKMESDAEKGGWKMFEKEKIALRKKF